MAEAEEMGAEEEVVVRLASMPQIISSESIVGGVGGAVGGAARASSSAGVELGRRLLLAARAGDTPQVLELMAQGAPFTTDWLGTSPLHLAAWGGHAGTCGVLLRAGVSRDARTKVERTPLHLAAHAGHVAVATVLLDHGAMIDCRDMLRMTPLHWACARAHGALAALLARRGADVRARCKFRRSPLQLAARLPPLLAALRHAVREREDARAVHAVCAAGDVHVQRVGVPGDVHVQRVTVPGDVHVQRVCAVGDVHAAGAVAMQEEAAEPEQKAPDGLAAPADDKPAIKIQQKINKPNLENERGGGGGGGGGAAALLRQHGITLLPADDGSTVLSALQSGRTVVLSDAGKLMLKENSTPTTAAAPPAPAPAPARAGVVLRACPARSPPRPGVKVFTVNKLPDTRNKPQDVQIKYVQLPGEATLLSPHKAAMKAKSKLARAVPGAGAGAGAAAAAGAAAGAGAGGRPGVKIIMNKASFSKLLATASRAHGAGDNEPLSLGGSRGEAVVCVPEQFVRSSSARYLRAQLLAAHAALAELQRELGQARAALAAQQSSG